MPKTNFNNLGVTVPAKADKPIAIPSAFEAFAESFGHEQGKGKLLIAQNTGAAAWAAMKGDATLAEDGTLTLANSASIYQVGEVSVTNAAPASFSTPIKVTLPRVNANQLIEIVVFGLASASVTSEGGTKGGTLIVEIPSAVIAPTLATVSGATVAANTWVPFISQTAGGNAGSLVRPVSEGSLGRTMFISATSLLSVSSSAATNVAVELKGACSGSGTIKVKQCYLTARITG